MRGSRGLRAISYYGPGSRTLRTYVSALSRRGVTDCGTPSSSVARFAHDFVIGPDTRAPKMCWQSLRPTASEPENGVGAAGSNRPPRDLRQGCKWAEPISKTCRG